MEFMTTAICPAVPICQVGRAGEDKFIINVVSQFNDKLAVVMRWIHLCQEANSTFSMHDCLTDGELFCPNGLYVS